MGEKFADPDVSNEILEKIQDITESEQPVYPWDVLESMKQKGYDKQEARKGLRKLRMSNHIVPTGEFIGKVCLAERYSPRNESPSVLAVCRR